MIRLIAHRLAFGVVTLWIISVVIFFLTQLLPGDVAAVILGQYATPEALANIRQELGLNLPWIQRYLYWIGSLLQGDLGKSLANGAPVADLLFERLKKTAILAALTTVVAVPLAIGLGIFAVVYRGRMIDRLLSTVTLIAVSVPEFFIAYVLIIVFGRKLGWFPSMAEVSDRASIAERLHGLALPLATLLAVTVGHIMRMTRAAIADILATPYIEMARIKGVSNWHIVIGHALPNAVAPIAQVTALGVAYLVVGVILVEVIFVYPGIGQLIVDAVVTRDIPVIQACGLIAGVVYVVLNLLADIAALIANPRLLHPK